MGILESITSPRDLRDLSDDQLEELASEIRDFLVRTCAPPAATSAPTSASWS